MGESQSASTPRDLIYGILLIMPRMSPRPVPVVSRKLAG